MMLNEQLLQERLANFRPEPLIDYKCVETKEAIEIPMVVEDENNIDLAKANYLNVLDNEYIKKTSENVIRKYGVGTCGPRAFYGTTDVHLQAEEALAKFLGFEETIVYSYGFVAISSSIAAYCKKSDVIFVDEEANFPIHQGLIAAKSRVVKFKHNDAKSLEAEVQKIVEQEKLKKKRSRKFLIIEGVSWKTGKLCDLPDFLNVAEDYKMRVFLEESYTIGIYGKTGRGLTEHFDIGPNRIDMIIGTLENAIGSIGGFCAGTSMMIEHQRLSGSGYIFSASLPTFLVQAIIQSVDILGEKPQQIRKYSRDFHDFLTQECKFDVSSDAEVPYKIFKAEDKAKETKIYEYCKENGVHFIQNDTNLAINLNISLFEDKKRLARVYDVLKKASTLK